MDFAADCTKRPLGLVLGSSEEVQGEEAFYTEAWAAHPGHPVVNRDQVGDQQSSAMTHGQTELADLNMRIHHVDEKAAPTLKHHFISFSL